MKKILLAAIAAIALGGVANAEAVKIGIDTSPYPPFASPDPDGNWSGWEIDIIHAVCKAAELECVITPTAWDGMIPSLTGGQIDAIMASMSITEERKKVIDFSDKYYNTPTSLLVPKGSTLKPTPDALKGKAISAQVSTIQEAYIKAHFPDSDLKTYQTVDEGFQDVAAGRVDASLADSIAIDGFLATDAGKACCENAGPVADDPTILGAGVGVGLRKGDPLKEKFNAAIKKIREDGTYDAITKKYFSSSIYGG
jgi:polar amino acid transport system substrate-binding protein